MADILGKAVVEIDADVSGAKQGLKEVRTDFDQTATSVGKSAGKIEGSIGGVSGAARRAGSSVVAFTSKLAMMAGVITLVVATITSLIVAFKAVRQHMRDGAKDAEEFIDSLDTKDAVSSLERLRDKIAEVESELGAKDIGGFLSIFGRRRKQIEEELEELNAKARRLTKQTIGDEQRRRREETQKRIADEQKVADAARVVNEKLAASLIENETDRVRELGRIRREEIKKTLDLVTAGLEEGDDERLKKLLEDRLGLIDRISEKELSETKKRIAKEEQLRKEANERIAKDFATKIGVEVTRAIDAGFSASGDRIVAELQQLVDTIQAEARARP